MGNSAIVLPDVMQPIQALFNRLNVTTRQVAGAWG
jgi:hypothetical protein